MENLHLMRFSPLPSPPLQVCVLQIHLLLAQPLFAHDLTLVCTVNFTLSFSLRASGISIWREGSTFRSTDTDLSCKTIHRIILDQASSRFSEAD